MKIDRVACTVVNVPLDKPYYYGIVGLGEAPVAGSTQDVPMLRGLAVWLLIAVLESLHGTLRELLLVPRLGAALSGRIGWPAGLLIVFGVTLALIRWTGLSRARDLLALGLAWAALTFAFEIGIGLARGFDAARILAEIDPFAGGLTLYSLAAMALSPLLAARLRGL